MSHSSELEQTQANVVLVVTHQTISLSFAWPVRSSDATSRMSSCCPEPVVADRAADEMQGEATRRNETTRKAAQPTEQLSDHLVCFELMWRNFVYARLAFNDNNNNNFESH